MALSVWPSTRLPRTSRRFAVGGSRPSTTPVAALVSELDPATLVAVTTTFTVSPISPEMSNFKRRSRGFRDFAAFFTCRVALEPLVGVGDRFGPRPRPARGTQRLAFDQAPEDFRCLAGRGQQAFDHARRGARFRTRPRHVGRGHHDLHRVPDQAGDERQRRGRRFRDFRAFLARRVALQPLVGVRDRFAARPRAAAGAEDLPFDEAPEDFGRLAAGRQQPGDHARRGARFRARPSHVGRRHHHLHRVPDQARDQLQRRVRRFRDFGAFFTRRVALQATGRRT